MKPLIPLLLASVLASGLARADDPALPHRVDAYDPSIHYIGHFDRSDPSGPKCVWSACTASLRFSGSAINLRLGETGGKVLEHTGVNQWQIVLDGKPLRVLKPQVGQGVYRIASDLAPGEHQLEIVRRTEGSLGVSQLLGFELSEDARLLPPQPKPRRIEVVGDSIVCGYGNESRSRDEHFHSDTQNAYMTFGAIAARAVDAEYSSVCRSGMTVTGMFGASSLFLRNSEAHGAPDADFFRSQPDVVLINLGTNDFANGNPPDRPWIDSYKALISRIRAHYPKAMIYAATSSMLSDGWPVNQAAWSTHARFLRIIVADLHQGIELNLRYIEFPTQNEANGIGGDWHPSVRTHQLMADIWVKALKKDLGW